MGVDMLFLFNDKAKVTTYVSYFTFDRLKLCSIGKFENAEKYHTRRNQMLDLMCEENCKDDMFENEELCDHFKTSSKHLNFF